MFQQSANTDGGAIGTEPQCAMLRNRGTDQKTDNHNMDITGGDCRPNCESFVNSTTLLCIHVVNKACRRWVVLSTNWLSVSWFVSELSAYQRTCSGYSYGIVWPLCNVICITAEMASRNHMYIATVWFVFASDFELIALFLWVIDDLTVYSVNTAVPKTPLALNSVYAFDEYQSRWGRIKVRCRVRIRCRVIVRVHFHLPYE